MDDIPWLYVAMIFIAFVSWVWNQIKDAAEMRREKAAEKKRAQHSRNSTEPDYESPYRTSSERDTVPEGPQSFRDVFKEIERQIQQADTPVQEPAPAPPPLPKAPRVQEEPVVGNFSFPTDVPELKARPPLAKVRRKKKRGNRETSNMLRDALRDSAQMKNALILREVLGPPRSRQKRRV